MLHTYPCVYSSLDLVCTRQSHLVTAIIHFEPFCQIWCMDDDLLHCARAGSICVRCSYTTVYHLLALLLLKENDIATFFPDKIISWPFSASAQYVLNCVVFFFPDVCFQQNLTTRRGKEWLSRRFAPWPSTLWTPSMCYARFASWGATTNCSWNIHLLLIVHSSRQWIHFGTRVHKGAPFRRGYNYAYVTHSASPVDHMCRFEGSLCEKNVT